MARRPNFGFERLERAKAKAAKREEKAKAKSENTNARATDALELMDEAIREDRQKVAT